LTAGWRVEITPPARRDLRRLDAPVRRRVLDALDRLVGDPPTGDVVKLQGRDEHRLRVGDWRVLISPRPRAVRHPRAPRASARSGLPRLRSGHE
jgi:mRNA interferase RelE/StbE